MTDKIRARIAVMKGFKGIGIPLKNFKRFKRIVRCLEDDAIQPLWFKEYRLGHFREAIIEYEGGELS